jgi:hypothetical protein
MKYTAQQPIDVRPGQCVRLSAEQLRRRRSLVTPHAERKGWFVATAAFQFKTGETFELDHELPKGMADAVEPKKAVEKAADKAHDKAPEKDKANDDKAAHAA